MAQAATICTVLRNLQKRKLQKRTQVSARRRTEVSVENREVQAMRMKRAPRQRQSAAVFLPGNGRCKVGRSICSGSRHRK